jgi:hypothetical protein
MVIDVRLRNRVTRMLANPWVHLVGVYGAARGTLSLYVNGVLQVLTTHVPQTWHATSIVHIRRADTGAYTTGAIDDVRIFAGALPASEVSKLYQP